MNEINMNNIGVESATSGQLRDVFFIRESRFRRLFKLPSVLVAKLGGGLGGVKVALVWVKKSEIKSTVKNE